MRPPAVIFDFDGVIVDTEPIHYRAFQQVLEPFGLGYSWEAYQDNYMGFDDRDAFKEAFKASSRPLDENTLEYLIKQKAEVFVKVIDRGVTPYPGVIDLIHTLADHSIPLAICSGALRSDIMPVLRQFDITAFFQHIVTAEDVPESKPNPASYIKARDLLLESSPEAVCRAADITAIEDTPAGIVSAKGAGLHVIAVTNSYPDNKLRQADRIIASLEELIRDWFKR